MSQTTVIVQPTSTPVTVTVTIPDPVFVTSGNTIVVNQPPPAISQSGGTPINPPPVDQTFTFTPATGDVYNGSRGLNNFFGNQVFKYPANDNYYRFSWAQLQTGTNSFNWSSFDSVADTALKSGQKLYVRVGCVDNTAVGGYVTINGVKSCYPAFVHDLMQTDKVKDWNDGKCWYPNWNSENFLSSWEAFVKAWAQHIIDKNYTNVIFSIDVGGYGNYLAEWNMYGINEAANGTVATAASQIRMIQSHITYFQNYPLILNQATFDTRYCSDQTAYFAINAKNSWGLLGFRSDHVGWYTTTAYDQKMMNRTYNGVNFLTEIRKRYQFAPCLAEPMNDVAGCTPAGGTPYQTVIDEVNYYHFSAISNEPSNAPSTAQQNFLTSAKISGYTIGITSAVISGNTLTLNWFNTGVAPIYENYDVYLIAAGQQILSTANLRSLQPGAMTTTDKNLPSGNYTLSIIVKDKTGYRKPLFLAITGRQNDGSYTIGNVVIQ